jgi:hypothetical protein
VTGFSFFIALKELLKSLTEIFTVPGPAFTRGYSSYSVGWVV